MKALDILEELIKLNKGEERKFVEEAITEIKALEGGSCDNCRHLQISVCRDGLNGAYCPYFGNCKQEGHLEYYWEAR